MDVNDDHHSVFEVGKSEVVNEGAVKELLSLPVNEKDDAPFAPFACLEVAAKRSLTVLMTVIGLTIYGGTGLCATL